MNSSYRDGIVAAIRVAEINLWFGNRKSEHAHDSAWLVYVEQRRLLWVVDGHDAMDFHWDGQPLPMPVQEYTTKFDPQEHKIEDRKGK